MFAEVFVGGLRVGVCGGVEELAYGVDVFEGGVVGEDDGWRLDGGHAVVGEDDEIDGEVEGVEAGVELTDEVVHVVDGVAGFGGVGCVFVGEVIDVVVVEGNEVGALVGRELEPVDDLVDALVVVEGVIELEVVGGALALDFGLGAGPEDAGGAHTLLLGEDPERGAGVPGSVAVPLGLSVDVDVL